MLRILHERTLTFDSTPSNSKPLYQPTLSHVHLLCQCSCSLLDESGHNRTISTLSCMIVLSLCPRSRFDVQKLYFLHLRFFDAVTVETCLFLSCSPTNGTLSNMVRKTYNRISKRIKAMEGPSVSNARNIASRMVIHWNQSQATTNAISTIVAGIWDC